MSTAPPPQILPAPASLGLLTVALVPFGLGYFLSYLLRGVNAVVAPDLVTEIGLSAADLGLLTAAYLMAFACFQLPLGILLDRYGPRRVQAALLTLAAVGALTFSLAASLPALTLSRALIGFGCAGGLMSGFKAVVLWVPEARRALANALVMSLGAIGLLCSTAPMEWAVSLAGWRAVFAALAGVTSLVAAAIFVLVPERAAVAAGDGLGAQIRSVGKICRDPAFLALAPFIGATAGVHIAIQTLWAGLWFRDVAGLDRLSVASHLLAMAAAFFAGILASGTIADICRRRGVSELTVMFGFLSVFLASQALIILDIPALRLPAWLAFGMCGQVAILAFPWLSSHFGAALSGRASTAMNLMIFITAFAAQYVIGAIIDLFPRTAGGGYPPVAYQAGFGMFLAIQLVALAVCVANRRRFARA